MTASYQKLSAKSSPDTWSGRKQRNKRSHQKLSAKSSPDTWSGRRRIFSWRQKRQWRIFGPKRRGEVKKWKTNPNLERRKKVIPWTDSSKGLRDWSLINRSPAPFLTSPACKCLVAHRRARANALTDGGLLWTHSLTHSNTHYPSNRVYGRD